MTGIPNQAERAKSGIFQGPLPHQALIILLGLLIYSNSFSVPFVFDDIPAIVQNPRVHDLGQFVRSGSVADSRGVGDLTFALNYAVSGLNVFGYHLVNLIVHLAASILVFWFVSLTLKTPWFVRAEPPLTERSRYLAALAVSLLFVSHPIQTQAVTYIVQRFASLAALFYLLSLVLYAQWRLTPGRASFAGRAALSAGSVLAAFLALRTKEIAATLPAVIILYESMFFSGRANKRVWYVLPYVVLGCVILARVIAAFVSFELVSAHDEAADVLMGVQRLSRSEYLFTQFRVIVTYLRLLVLPVGQNLDYDYPVSHAFLQPAVVASCALILALLGLAAWLSRGARGDKDSVLRLVSFGLFWFFITLSVESSIIPIDDVIMEHRVYLPSVGFFLAVAGAGSLIVKRLGKNRNLLTAGALLCGTTLTVLSLASYTRNATWGDAVSLYEDIAAKSPLKTRPHIGLGAQYEKRGLFDEAAREYSTALLLNPRDALAHYNLGNLYYNHGLRKEALLEYQAVIAVTPDSPYSHLRIGIIYYRDGRFAEARRELETTVKLEPGLAEARYYLELLSRSTGNHP